jgi:transmembrane sensor
MQGSLFKNTTLESIIQFIEGNIANTERPLVESWINANPQNREFFDKLKEVWMAPDEIGALRKEYIEKDWNNIFLRIQKSEDDSSEELQTLIKRNSLKNFIRIAASVLIIASILGAYLVGRYRQSQNKEPQLTYNEIIVPKGQRSQIILSDSSQVWINAGSKLRFANQFNGDKREVWLDGEAFFTITKDDEKPFYVHTGDLNVKVLGTSFNIAAYSNEDIVETSLLEGSVSIQTNGNQGVQSEEVLLKPSHKAIFLKREDVKISEETRREFSQPLVANKIIISKPVDIKTAVSWTEGKLVFSDETFDHIVIELERKYDVRIFVDDENINKTKYTGVLKNISIEQALRAIQLSMPINYTIHDNIVRITGRNFQSKPK